MKRLLFALIVAVPTIPALAGDVSATIGINQPGFYGQINIGDVPRPVVIYSAAGLGPTSRQMVYVEPIYVRVPPGHEKHWSKHCADYGACGRPVYFVREDWYQTYYVPRYQHRDDDERGEGHDQDGKHGHGHGNDQGDQD